MGRHSDYLHWYGPPRSGEDLDRVYQVLEVIAKVYPEARFDRTHVQLKPVPMPADRESWIFEQMNPPQSPGDPFRRGGSMTFLESGPDGVMVRCRDRWGERPTIDGDVEGTFSVEIFLSSRRAAGKHEEIMVGIGDALEMWHGTYDPGHEMYGIWQVQMDGARYNFDMVEALGFDIPILYPYHLPDRQDIPYYFGWLNYWSASMARWLGFPDPIKDAGRLPLAHQSQDTGAWLLALTEEPWDQKRTDHVAVLEDAWRRFDRLGVREPPEDNWRSR